MSKYDVVETKEDRELAVRIVGEEWGRRQFFVEAIVDLAATERALALAVADVERLRKREEEAREFYESIRDSILNERHQLAEEGCTSEQINSVLGIIDDFAPAWLAAAKEGE